MRQIQAFFFMLVSFVSGCPAVCIAQTLPPNDANKYQLVIVGDADGPAKWFESDPNLSAVKKLTAFTNYPSNSVLFRERFENRLGSDFPIVAVLRPDGGVIYFADAQTLPETPRSLFDDIKEAMIKAKEANPAKKQAEIMAETEAELTEIMGEEAACPDGNCPVDSKPVLFPRLRPNKVTTPTERIFGGIFKDTLVSGIWLVFSIIALGFVVFFFVLLIAAIFLVTRVVR